MELWTHIKTIYSCLLDSKDLSKKPVLWVCLLKSSGHTTEHCLSSVYSKDFFLKSYMDINVLNQWTHGLWDTQHILLQSSPKFVIYALLLNQWTHGVLDTHQN